MQQERLGLKINKILHCTGLDYTKARTLSAGNSKNSVKIGKKTPSYRQ